MKTDDWANYHRPNEAKYMAEDKPQQRADIILDNNVLKEELSNIKELWEKAAKNS